MQQALGDIHLDKDGNPCVKWTHTKQSSKHVVHDELPELVDPVDSEDEDFTNDEDSKSESEAEADIDNTEASNFSICFKKNINEDIY